jgi:2-oxoglutarate dehydrogenase E2 component (dihydrolipoamide succinyltransferase)
MPQFVDIRMPEEQDGAEAIVLGWLKEPGGRVEIHEPVLEISTDKVTMEVAAPASGVLHEVLKQANDTVHPGEVLGRIAVGAAEEASEEPAEGETSAEPVAAAAPGASGGPEAEREERSHRLSPLVKRMLQEHDLSPEQIPGTGRGGRITHKDVQAYLDRKPEPTAPTPTAAAAGKSGIPGRLIPHSAMRRSIANHMVESMLRVAPHVTSLFDADMTAVMDHRARHRQSFAQKGVKLTYTAYFIQAAVEALHAVPTVNSRWHADALEVFEDFNIGVATALGDEGLIVPVIHEAQHLGLFGIATRLQERIEQARAGTLPAAAVQRGTFTITNHGVSGSLIATPIINQPQSAILGIGRLEKRVVVREERGRDTLQVCPMLYITLTIDHRALDGFQANTFLSRFVEVLQNWT